MKNLISGMLAVIFFIILAFGGVLIWDIAGNDGKITNSLFIEIENDDEDVKTHDCEFDTEYSYNETKHWFACLNEDCSETKYESAHVFEWVIDKEPTYTAQGIKHEACVCGAVRNEYTVIETLPIQSTLKLNFITDTVFNGVSCKKIENEITAQLGMIDDTISYSYEKNYISGDYNPVLYTIRWQSETTDVSTLLVGTIARFNDNLKIVFRAVPGNDTVPYSLDFLKDGERYRYIDNKLELLFNDYKECGYINFEAGSFKYNGVAVYGFRFSTENEEFTYLSDNTGDIKNDTTFFKCLTSNSTSGTETTSLYSFMSDLDSNSIQFNSSNFDIIATTMISYATDSSATYVSVENTSNWLLSQIKEN